MSVIHRIGNAPAEPATTTPPQPTTVPARSPARTRTSAAWLGACLASAVLSLLIAAVGASLLTMTFGAARITQLRRRLRRHH